MQVVVFSNWEAALSASSLPGREQDEKRMMAEG
jgi:hypothetical protein